MAELIQRPSVIFLHRTKGERYVEWAQEYFGSEFGFAFPADGVVAFSEITERSSGLWRFVFVEAAMARDPAIQRAIRTFIERNPKVLIFREYAAREQPQGDDLAWVAASYQAPGDAEKWLTTLRGLIGQKSRDIMP